MFVPNVGGAPDRAGVSSALTCVLNEPIKRNLCHYLESSSNQMSALIFYRFPLIFVESTTL